MVKQCFNCCPQKIITHVSDSNIYIKTVKVKIRKHLYSYTFAQFQDTWGKTT